MSQFQTSFIKSRIMTFLHNGPGGNRTRVQTGIPRSSTIIVSSSVLPKENHSLFPAETDIHQDSVASYNLLFAQSLTKDDTVLKLQDT